MLSQRQSRKLYPTVGVSLFNSRLTNFDRLNDHWVYFKGWTQASQKHSTVAKANSRLWIKRSEVMQWNCLSDTPIWISPLSSDSTQTECLHNRIIPNIWHTALVRDVCCMRMLCMCIPYVHPHM